MRHLLTAAAVGVSVGALSQTDADALRYSIYDYMGSARLLGAGGAFTALGGDLAGIALNPAGIGQYRAGEIVFSPSFHIASTETRFLSETQRASRVNFNVSNFGLVFSNSKSGSGKSPRGAWETLNWGFGFNRLANFNDHVFMNGINDSNSIIDRFVEEATGTHADNLLDAFPFSAGLAYEAYLFDPNIDSISYAGRVPDGGIQQSKEIRSSGSMEEWFVALGANLSDRLMFGATINFPGVGYEEESWHEEQDHNDSIPNFTHFTYYNWLHTRGGGISGNVGVTGLIGDVVRIGVAYHAPAYMGLRDSWFASIQNDEPNTYEESGIGAFRYALITPAHINGGLAVVFKKYGFISADYSYVDYSGAEFRFRGNDPSEQAYEDFVNQNIRDKYRPASSIRVGGELVIREFRCRVGAQFHSSPFRAGVAPDGGDQSRTSYSGGVGYRGKNFFADAAYVITSTGTFHVPYTLADPNEVVYGALIDRTTHNLIFTLGYKFR